MSQYASSLVTYVHACPDDKLGGKHVSPTVTLTVSPLASVTVSLCRSTWDAYVHTRDYSTLYAGATEPTAHISDKKSSHVIVRKPPRIVEI
jgi:hypothetical protein